MSRLDELPENAFIEEIRQLRIDLNELKNDQQIKTNKLNIKTTGIALMPIASYTTTSKIVGFGIANSQVEHGLGYTPICLGFMTGLLGANQSAVLPWTNIFGGNGVRTITQIYQVSADDIYVYLTASISYVSNSAESRSDTTIPELYVKYYLLEESAI